MAVPSETAVPPAGLAVSLNRALRTYQWVKNVLLFVPMLMAHRVGEGELWVAAALGFVAFSLTASSGYVVNDLVDREADRLHPAKRHRPFASGALSPAFGYLLAPTLLAAAFAIAWSALPSPFLWALGVYLVTTLAYSFALKRSPVLDVFVLAGLYTLRILAGGAATGVPVSEWLLAFSMFFFLSLALLKRFAELRRLDIEPERSLHGRGYRGEDLGLLRTAGAAAGYLSVLVLVLYVASPEVAELYERPTLLWVVGALVLFWITRLWLLAGRSVVDDDPILFAARDPASYAVAALAALTLAAATV
ncbi:MAG TPA: UbiA family prenyltransferase [Polyangiaceae bacterium]|nr:UbiA family prenyltransferase [Polyangiaceae bacterium]